MKKTGKEVDKIKEFEIERETLVNSYKHNEKLKSSAKEFLVSSALANYSYNFTWLGRPIIQWPQDIVAMQEIIWRVKPDLIIETGIAHGGSLIFYSSMLNLLESAGFIENGKVLGVDIDIREHNLKAIQSHPFFNKITMFEGSSISVDMINRVKKFAADSKKILVCLDSNHTHEHVYKELLAYSPFVSNDSYCVVFDTLIEDMPPASYDRPWDVGNNPRTAVDEFLKTSNEFEIDEFIANKLQISASLAGYLYKK